MSLLPRLACVVLLFGGWQGSFGQATPAPAPVVASVPTAASAPAVAPAYASNPKYTEAMSKGHLAMQHKDADTAKGEFKKADKIAGGQSSESLEGLYQAEMRLGSYKDAAATAVLLEGVVTTPWAKSSSETKHAQALLAQAGEKPKPAQLEAIEAALKAAIANEPKNATALFLDGEVLARLGKMDDAHTEFAQCVSCLSPRDPAMLRAKHFADNPALSLQKMAPAFVVTALDGTKFNLDAMGGRVVLIDFWATWCGPCNEELPHMKKIAKEFAGQPLVIISVSWDSDEQKWKDFIAKNEMTWVQYRDADHVLTNQFGINAIPHYFTIDSDGVLTSEMLGEGSDVEGKLKKLVAKARAAQASMTAANAVTTPGEHPGN